MTVAEELEAISDALYERTAPLWVPEEGEPLTNRPGQVLCKAVMGMLQDLDVITADTATHPGWSIITDPTVCPPAWLLWCAQLYGETPPAGLTEAELRTFIETPPQESRGSLAAMEAEANATLTGGGTVTITEQSSGHAYHITAHSRMSQTPNEKATLQALLSQKPGGITLVYSASEAIKFSEATKRYRETGGVRFSSISSGEV